MSNKTEKKKSSYISAKESRKITRFNRKLTRRLEKERANANKNPDQYVTKMKDPNNVVEFDNVCTYFFTDIGTVKAVDGINFEVPKCSTVGIVGESGCGKSVTSLSLMQLLQRPSGQTVGGEIRLNMGDGTAYNIVNTPTSKMQELRGNKISMIFQEPMTSLNPVFRIGRQVDEVIELHNPDMTKEQVKERTLEMLELVGIANKEGVYKMYPHELSGGMRQRVMIAIALACNPGLIIADEPTTALDVTIQAQILDLLQGLKDKIKSSIMLITHDLGVVAGMADYVVVMYAGRVVEKGTADDIFHHPAHPYTIGLMKSKPVVGKKVDKLYDIPGSVPNPVDMPNYCYFRDRCEMRCDQCDGKYPPEIKISDTHVVSCYRYFDQGEVLGYPKSVNVEEL
ncbi:MAG: ABC transporter ATP-binding protein [Candidatus Faecousia sp.]|nr:ABC transporter ATP-binding protein [Clostridiales bacterium]MDD7652880.1 ABC transporter ATP-binding protein [Bacillota bacterium]MDY4220256.1 ABC transporter ATP-binding protein [Candidatus Faecousia sp.]